MSSTTTSNSNTNTTTIKPGRPSRPFEPHSQPLGGKKETRERFYRDRRETWLALQPEHPDTTPPLVEARQEVRSPRRSRDFGAQVLTDSNLTAGDQR